MKCYKYNENRIMKKKQKKCNCTFPTWQYYDLFIFSVVLLRRCLTLTPFVFFCIFLFLFLFMLFHSED